METPKHELKIAVSGTRNLSSCELESAMRILEKVLTKPRDKKLIVVHGGARGIDQMAGGLCKRLGIACEVYPPDYSKGNPYIAPLLRNTTIATVSDNLVAFWANNSKGTLDTIQKFKSLGKPCVVFTLDNGQWRIQA